MSAVPVARVLSRAGYVLAGLGALLQAARPGKASAAVLAGGLLLLAAGLSLGYEAHERRSVVGRTSGKAGPRDQLVGILLNLGLAFVLAVGGFVALGLVVEPTAYPRLPYVLVAALAALVAVLHERAQATQAPFVPRRDRLVAAALALSGAAAAVGGVAAVSADGPAPLLYLLGSVLLAVTLFVLREIPNPYAILASPQFRAVTSRGGVNLVPYALGASAASFGLALVGSRLVGERAFGPVSADVAATVAGVVLGIALLAAAVAQVAFASGERLKLYQTQSYGQSRVATGVLALSALLTVVFLAAAFLLWDSRRTGEALFGFSSSRWVDALALATLCATGPYGFYLVARERRIDRIEEGFPDFLRDLASGRKTGLTLPKAVSLASRTSYGALDTEIWKMRAQLDWNVPFETVMSQFSERVRTPRVRRAVAVVQEAEKLGGNISEVLAMTARNVRELKTLEKDRSVTMVLYVVIIYLAFFVFLGIVAVLYSSLIPAFAEASAAAGAGPVLISSAPVEDYRTFYFVAALAQAVGNGILAGIIQRGRVAAGLPHAFAMVALAFVTFAVVL